MRYCPIIFGKYYIKWVETSWTDGTCFELPATSSTMLDLIQFVELMKTVYFLNAVASTYLTTFSL